MPMIDVEGLGLHYQQLGRLAPDGRDLVLVHGLAADLAFWYLGAAPYLAAAGGDRITMYDLRGHGLSDTADHGYTTAALARELLALLDRLRLRRTVLIGHSYGAAIALHAAVLNPPRVAGVVIADGYLPCFERGRGRRDDRRAARTIRALQRRGLAVPDNLPRVAYGLIDDLVAVPSPGPMPSQLAIRRWEALRTSTTAVPDIAVRSLSRQKLRSDPIRRMPLLAVYGDRTPCHSSLQGLQQVRPDIQLARITGAGHLHPYRRPRVFAERVRPFLDQLQTVRPGPPANPVVMSHG
jgi:2-hydroxy-6-oxonona-2,4-dienedioate hydrolase